MSLAWDMGYMIAVPLVIFALLGRYLDKLLESSPWLFLTGLVLALISSTIWVVSYLMKFLSKTTDNVQNKK